MKKLILLLVLCLFTIGCTVENDVNCCHECETTPPDDVIVQPGGEAAKEGLDFFKTYEEFLVYIIDKVPYEGDETYSLIQIAKQYVEENVNNNPNLQYKVSCKAYYHNQSGNNHVVYVGCSDGTKWMVLLKGSTVALVYQQGT